MENKTADSNAAYLIILGASLKGEVMSLSLYNRMVTALDYLNENPNTKVIVTGGQGKGESITEAEAMARFLLEHGVSEKRIMKEDRSTSTYENLVLSQELLGTGQKEIVIVSNDFHLFRAGMIAKRLGFEPQFIAAPTPDVVKVQLWLREYAAVVKSFLLDW
ncbi:YdcF family protein [bacterium LRH843]|nr:YdcF family protein [bacterium LRH843]